MPSRQVLWDVFCYDQIYSPSVCPGRNPPWLFYGYATSFTLALQILAVVWPLYLRGLFDRLYRVHRLIFFAAYTDNPSQCLCFVWPF